MGLDFKDYLNSHLRVKLPVPTKSFSGQTIIVTGSNSGMGLEAAKHFVALNAEKVILAVRSVPRGKAALKTIEESTNIHGVAEVWELDLASYSSVEAFAKRALTLSRLDIVVANAGIYLPQFSMAENNETTITVNVVSHMLLALLLLPKLRETSVQTGKPSVFTMTGSFTHFMTEFSERNSEHILADLADESKAQMSQRYYVSKLIQLQTMREFADELTKSVKPGKVITSAINPGFVATDILRNRSYLVKLGVTFLRMALARTAEEGGRTLVHGAEGGEETHGQYLNDCAVGKPSEFVLSVEGEKVQKQLWKELTGQLEVIHPGIMENL